MALAPALAKKLWPVVIMLLLNGISAAFYTAQTTTWWEENSETDLAKRMRAGYKVLAFIIGIGLTLLLM